MKLFGDQAAVSQFSGCKKADAYRIFPVIRSAILNRVEHREQEEREERAPLRPDAKKDSYLAAVRIRSGPDPLRAADLRELVELMTNPASYRDRKWECEPDPGIAIRFFEGDNQWDVLICLECDFLSVHRNGEPRGFAEFQPAREDFQAIMKRLFPNDQEIQQIK